MCQIYIFKKILDSDEIDDGIIDEAIEQSLKVEKYTKEGDSKKIMKLQDSKNLLRIHLPGRERRMVFKYENNIIKICDIFFENSDDRKIKRYDNLSKHESKFDNLDCFKDITPKKIKESKEVINQLNEIKKLLESSALNSISDKKNLKYEDILIGFDKQKWVRKYPKMKEIFNKLRHKNLKNSLIDLIFILNNIKKRSKVESFIDRLYLKKNGNQIKNEIEFKLSNRNNLTPLQQIYSYNKRR